MKKWISFTLLLLGFATIVACSDDEKIVEVPGKDKDALAVLPTELEFIYRNAPSQEVLVSATAGSFTPYKDQEWITVTPGTGSITVSVSDNDTGEERTGNITITSGNATAVTVKVTQAGEAQYEYSISVVDPETGDPFTGYNYPWRGSFILEDPVNFTIITNMGEELEGTLKINIPEDALWITTQPSTINPGEYFFNVVGNNTQEVREAVITVTGYRSEPVTLTITQEAAPFPMGTWNGEARDLVTNRSIEWQSEVEYNQEGNSFIFTNIGEPLGVNASLVIAGTDDGTYYLSNNWEVGGYYDLEIDSFVYLYQYVVLYENLSGTGTVATENVFVTTSSEGDGTITIPQTVSIGGATYYVVVELRGYNDGNHITTPAKITEIELTRFDIDPR